MKNQINTIVFTDLVIVIDTSPSMKDEARAVSRAASAAIEAAKSSCPSDLRVVWFGIEGTWKGTKFNQSVRTYLTKKCKVSASKLKCRKKGMLKSAGAQEDAARVIEDISNYFNWREGALRAIFYLGDEALDGGGNKTEQKDIDAANLAIQKAKAAEVSVHTYFGTSKSKYQESIAKEYARVAAETGGQTFTDQDTLQSFSTVLEKVICSSSSNKMENLKLESGQVYIQDCVSNKLSKLYTLDLTTGKATFIDEIVTEVADIAFVGSQLYGLDREGNKTQLVKIDLNSGDTTIVGDIGFATAGLAYNPQDKTLYATTAKQIISINLETGKGKSVIKVADEDYNCGEVAFAADGKAYVTLIGYNRNKLLASCNLETGEVEMIGDTGFPDLASMEFIDGILYGVTGNFFDLGKDGQLIRLDITTGKGTLITQTAPISRWAGITIYQSVVEEDSVAKEDPDKETETTNSQNEKTSKEEKMKFLTIDTKDNCYVINPDGMNNLQQNVANSFTFDKGTFDIKIVSGRYSYAKAKTGGEPFVLLWIYGVDGSTFINKSTGYEVGATWTTLNGYNDRLQLEVKEKAVLSALFFDVNNTDNNGSVNLLITGQEPSFQPHQLAIDSKKNCYVLNEKNLSNLQKWDSNFIELKPGNYRIKIREGNATYWSDNKKFDIEPWALIWIKAGKFIPKLTGIEIEETWCSLNGLKDEFILEVKSSTTLTGYFFDTYKEDNEGQVILEINEITDTALTQEYEQINILINQSNFNVVGSGSGSSSGTSTDFVVSGSGSSSSGLSFTFDQAQMEQMWQQMAAQIETSITVSDQHDENKEAYWDNLEKWILKGYQNQAKDLAMKVARVEFLINTLTQQMEVVFNQNFQNWSSYFNKNLNDLFFARIPRIVSEQVNLRIADQTQEIRNLVIQQMQSDIDQRIETAVNLKITNQSQEIKNQVIKQMQTDIDNRIDTVLNLKITDKGQEINNQVIQQIQTDIDQRIENAVNLKITDKGQEINNQVIQQIQTDIDQRIDSVVNLKIADQTQNIKNLVIQQLQADIDQRINNVVNLQITDKSQEMNNLVIQQIQADIDQRLDSVVNLKIADQTQNIKNLVIQQIQTDIDQRLDASVNVKLSDKTQEISNLVIQQLQADIDQRLDSVVNLKIADQTQNIKNLVIQQIQTDIDNRLDASVNLKLGDKTQEINNLVIQNIQADIDKRINTAVNLKINDQTQNIKNLVIQQIQTDIDQRINTVVDQSTDNNVQVVVKNVINDIDNRINVNIEDKILNFRNDFSTIVKNEINQNFTESIKNTIFSDIKKQQFYIDMQSIKVEVENFYARLGQFENQLYLRIEQGDTQLYNWTLEQLIALQGCLTDRQALVEMFESFAAKLKDELDNAECVSPNRFNPWVRNMQAQIEPRQFNQLPEA